MHSPEFKAKALRIIDECDGSCLKASHVLGAASPKALQRWRDERKKKPRRRYAHLSRSQKKGIARLIEQGTSARALSDRYGISVAAICNIRDEYCQKGALSFMDRKEEIGVPRIDPSDLPDDVEELKRRCAELELDNAILEQAIEMLKKRPGRRPV